jgi:hypothetical protein
MNHPDLKFIPGPGRIFVFGSNRMGLHGGGAALYAQRFCGALMGYGEGLQGSSYGIPTKDESIRTLPLSAIAGHVRTFLEFARSRPDLTFFVTRIGCGLAGYVDEQIAPMFAGAPNNVELPTGWRG